MKTNPELAQALTNLRASTDFQTVLDFFVREREIARDELDRVSTEVNLYRTQGRSLFLKDFLNLVGDAPDDLEKFKNRM